jgi:hypothetical protein
MLPGSQRSSSLNLILELKKKKKKSLSDMSCLKEMSPTPDVTQFLYPSPSSPSTNPGGGPP